MSGIETDHGRSVFPLRPLGVGEVLDAAVSTIRAYPRVTLAPAAVMYGSLLAVLLGFAGIIAALLYGSDDPALQTVATALGALGVIGAESLGGLLQLAAVTVFSTVMAGVVARAALGRPAPLRAVWRDTRRSLGWLVLYALMLNAALLVPLILLIPVAFVITLPVVGPYLYVAGLALIAVATTFCYAQVWLAPPAIVVERVHVLRGIARAWRITATGRWRATGIVALTMLLCLLLWAALSAGLASLLALVTHILSIGFSPTVLAVITTAATFLGGLLVGAAVTPFLAVVAGVAYFDQRNRAEGFDLLLGELGTSGRLRGLHTEATMIGPGTVFAGPGDGRPPEPPPGTRRPAPPPVAYSPMPAQPPAPGPVRIGGPR